MLKNGAFLFLFFFFNFYSFFTFLFITWCWINTFKKVLPLWTKSPLFGFSLPVDWEILHTTNVQSQNALQPAPQIHTVYSRTQLSVVPFWFPSLHKKKTKKPNSYSTAHIRFILLGSAYGTFLFYYNSVCTRIFSFRTEWKWQMTKCIFLANTQEHKCTSANGIWVKYIYI